jgi:DMSO/TMAO reductase YedYZ molybdopterin-dependent catalytic subunit
LINEIISKNEFSVKVRGLVNREIDLHYHDFLEGKLGRHLDVSSIVPKFSGLAIWVYSLLELVQPAEECTHVIFRANDDFQATFPLTDLQDALLLFQQDGAPLKKGFPVRLLIPKGWSECLNVKSVAEIEFVKKEQGESKATFGFKNIVQSKAL